MWSLDACEHVCKTLSETYDGNFFKLPFTTAVGDKNDEGNRDCDSLEIHFYAYARLIYYSITCNFLKIKNFN